jgi:hypothetical protein
MVSDFVSSWLYYCGGDRFPLKAPFPFLRFVLQFCVLVASVTVNSPNAFAQLVSSSRPFWEYHLGRGLRVGDTGLTVGGYGTLRYEEPRNQPREFASHALSLFLSWDTGKWVSFFSELELEDFAVIREGHGFGSRRSPFEAERLYVDLTLSNLASIRLGKFLTPIGRWNLIHADPLVWTTSRPLVTFRPFSVNTTGAMLYGDLSQVGPDLEYSLYAEMTDELSPDTREQPFQEAVGLHVLYHLSHATELGFSYANFERKERSGEERENLFGVDFLWQRQRYELTGEWVYRFDEKRPYASEWGLFAQGTVPLTSRLYGIGRYEYFSPRDPERALHLWIAGLTFRPLSAISLKAEYSIGRHNSLNVPEGFATSLTVLF